MQEKLSKLKELLNEVADLEHAAAVLSWDQQTFMPPGGAQDRAHQLALLSSLGHEKFTSAEIGALLEQLEEYGNQLPPDSDDACLLKVTARNYLKQTKVPSKLVADFAQVTAMAQHVWEQARAENDYAKFCPHLEKVFDLRREYAQIFAPFNHIYDPLLDDFEPGLKTADVKKIFAELRARQVELVKEIADRPQVDDSFLHQQFGESIQWDFGKEVITKFGYDWNRGRLDKVAHPFTTNFGLGDVRITTRLDPDYLFSGLGGTMHECGHALYEMGIAPALERSPLGTGASLAIHESQSRLWENLVGRSRDFWAGFYPELQNRFPGKLDGISLDKFYRGINKVEPSLIRVEADEATYNLHIMLRLELEIGVLEGKIACRDLPEIWREHMKEYLGVCPETDADGVLQDVHWSCGAVGYFSTYALGNLVSAQLWECINHDVPDLSGQIRNREFAALFDWLRENIHRHGAKFEPQELVKKVTGSKITPEPYLKYLRKKYSEVYGF